MINEKLLDKAILEHHKKILAKELHECIIYGSNDMSQIYGLYLKKTEERRPKNWRMQFAFWQAVIVIASAAFGWQLKAVFA